jgi:hypothetical protein
MPEIGSARLVPRTGTFHDVANSPGSCPAESGRGRIHSSEATDSKARARLARSMPVDLHR